MEPEWFAGRLRELREAAGLSQQDLSDKSGVKLGTLRDIEQGVSFPGWDKAIAIAKALKIDVGELAKRPAEHPPPKRGRPKKANGTTGSTPKRKKKT